MVVVVTGDVEVVEKCGESMVVDGGEGGFGVD